MDDTGTPPIQHPKASLSQLVRNLAIDRQRRRSFESQVFTLEEEGLHVAAMSSPEAHAIQQQQLTLVASALALLPERTRAVFVLHRLGGQTQCEVAHQFGISATLVNFLIRDATQTCRAALGAH
jgi:RNA polymerase sigma factor (sigma-70 family)